MYCFYLRFNENSKKYEIVLFEKDKAYTTDIMLSNKEFGSIKYGIESLKELIKDNDFSDLSEELCNFIEPLANSFLERNEVIYHRCLDKIFDKLD